MATKKTTSPRQNISQKVSNARKKRRASAESRAHRSFRVTRRRDVPKPVALPGYIRFTVDVFQMLATHRAIFIRLVLLVWVFSLLLLGATQQTQYDSLRENISLLSGEVTSGEYKAPLEVGTLFLSVATGGLSLALSETQQLYMSLTYLFIWLVVVWLLRHLVAGAALKLRDGLYNAGAPLLSTLLIALAGLVQLLPAALGVVVFSSATSSGLITGGIEAGVLFCVMLLLIVLSLYWVTSTFFAFIIATLPGTYPWAALRSAGDIVAGQRLRILLRMLWLGLVSLLVFALLMLPTIALDGVIRTSWLPLVTIVFQLICSAILVYAAAYVYLLYRKVIDGRDK